MRLARDRFDWRKVPGFCRVGWGLRIGSPQYAARMKSRAVHWALVVAVGALPGCGDPATQGEASESDRLPLVTDEPPCTVTELASPRVFDTTERSGITADGRIFFIGTEPESDGSSRSWIAELVIDPAGGKPEVVNRVAGSFEGTEDGTLMGAPLGVPCVFSGMAVHGELVYAACATSDFRASLVQVDLARATVRTGEFTTCVAEPAATPCASSAMYLNGMSIDDSGRLYATNTATHLNGGPVSTSVIQVRVLPDQPDPVKLGFRYRSWLRTDFIADGIVPNGIQIDRGMLYFAAFSNIDVVPIQADGSAGPPSVHYRGDFLSYIDDFYVDGRGLVLARTLPGDVAAVGARDVLGLARTLGTCRLPGNAIPSSVIRLAAIPGAAAPLNDAGYLVTAFFGGGLYRLNRLH